MKSLFKHLSVLFVLAAVITSCSVQKRKYNKGWHVDWAHSKTTHKEAESRVKTPPVKSYAAKPAEHKTPEVITAAAAEKKQEQAAEHKAVPAKNSVEILTKEPAVSSHEKHIRVIPFLKSKVKPVTLAQKAKSSEDNTDLLAILSFVFGILALVTGILAIPAIILGNMALKQYKEGKGDSDKRIFALIGLILGWIVVALIILFLLIFFIVLAAFI